MKKLFIFMLLLLSSFLLVGCGNNENLDTDKDTSSNTKEKKSKDEDGKYIKKLICNKSANFDASDYYGVIIIDFDDGDKATSAYLSYQYTIHEDIYNQQEDKENFMDGWASFIKKNSINDAYEKFKNFNPTNLETTINGRSVYFSFSFEYPEDEKDSFDEKRNFWESKDGYSCTVDYAQVG